MFASAEPRVLNKHNTVHLTAICLITGAFRTSPIFGLLSELEKLPMNLRREYLITCFWVHLKGSLALPVHNIIENPLEASDSLFHQYQKNIISSLNLLSVHNGIEGSERADSSTKEASRYLPFSNLCSDRRFQNGSQKMNYR